MRKILFILSVIVFVVIACNQPSKKDVIRTEAEEVMTDTIKEDGKTQEPQKKKYKPEDLEKYFTRQQTSSQLLIQPKGITSESNGIYCYFRLKGDRASGMRLRIQYWSEQYALADQYRFIVDGKYYTYIANRNKSDSGNSQIVDSAVFFWFDNDMKQNDLAFAEALADSEDSKVKLIDRATGETLATITLTESDKLSLRRTIDYYFALNGAVIPKEGMVNIRG